MNSASQPGGKKGKIFSTLFNAFGLKEYSFLPSLVKGKLDRWKTRFSITQT